MADELFFKARNETAAADFQRIGFAFAAVERFAVDFARKVDHRDVTVFQCRVFDRNQFGMLLGHGLQLFFDHVVGHFGMRMIDRQAFVVAEFDFRLFDECRFEGHILAFFKGHHVDVRLRDRDEILFAQGPIVKTVHQQFARFTEYDIFTEMRFQNFPRRFAFAESRNIYLLRQTRNRVLNSFGDFFRRYFNGQCDLMLIHGSGCYFHKRVVLLCRHCLTF